MEKVILCLYEDGNISYNNMSTNYGALSSIGRGGAVAGQVNAQQLALLQQQQLALGAMGQMGQMGQMGYDFGGAFAMPQAAPAVSGVLGAAAWGSGRQCCKEWGGRGNDGGRTWRTDVEEGRRAGGTGRRWG